MKILESYDWPGNVRELKNVIESASAIVRRRPDSSRATSCSSSRGGAIPRWRSCRSRARRSRASRRTPCADARAVRRQQDQGRQAARHLAVDALREGQEVQAVAVSGALELGANAGGLIAEIPVGGLLDEAQLAGERARPLRLLARQQLLEMRHRFGLPFALVVLERLLEDLEVVRPAMRLDVAIDGARDLVATERFDDLLAQRRAAVLFGRRCRGSGGGGRARRCVRRR